MYRRRYLERLRQGGKYNLPESRKLNEIEEPDDATETISDLAIHGRAIVVTGLPDWMYASRDPDAALHHFFDILFPGQIDSVVLARQPSSELVTCMEERKDIYTRMESALADKRKCLAGGEKEARYVRPLFSVEEVKRKSERCCNCCRSSCCDRTSGGLNDDVDDAVDDDVTMTVGVQRELDEVEERLSKLLLETGCGSTLGHEIYEEMTGYVVFRSVAGRSLAVQSLLTTPWESSNISEEEKRKKGDDDDDDDDDEKEGLRAAPDIVVRPAPEPRDVVHDNIGALRFQWFGKCCSPRVVAFQGVNVLLLIFWAAPVALMTSLTQLDSLEKQFPSLKPMLENSVLKGYLQGFLPTLGIVLFMSILPYIFLFLAKAEGMTRWSDIDAAATSRYVTFQIINVLFVSAFSGGVFQTADELIKQPGRIVDLLGTAIPDTYFFFTSYLMLLAFTIYPIELCQFFPLMVKPYYMSSSTTLSQYAVAARPYPITGGYAKQYGYVLLSFAITMEFATVAPLLLPFGVLFFGFGYVILRHNLYYTYDTPYDGEGKMFQWSMGVLCALSILVLLTLIGIFYSRGSPLQATLTWPMIPLVIFFWWYEEKKHGVSFTTLSLQDMRKREREERRETERRERQELQQRVAEVGGSGGSGGSGSGGGGGGGGLAVVRKLRVDVTCRHYAWMATNRRVNDNELKEGMPLRGLPSAHVYLHPIILQSRLGRLPELTEELDDENSALLARKKAVDFTKDGWVQTEQERNMLKITRRLTTREVHEGVKDEEQSLLPSIPSANGGVHPRTEKESKGSEIPSGDDEEEIAGGFGLLRSRWRLWAWSQCLAFMFIVLFYVFYHANIGNIANGGKNCSS